MANRLTSPVKPVLEMTAAEHLAKAADLAERNNHEAALVYLGFAQVLTTASSSWPRILGEKMAITARKIVDETIEFLEVPDDD